MLRSPRALLWGALCSSILILPACKQKAVQAEKRPPVPVGVARAEQRNVPVELHAIGNVEAISSVGVRAQIGGELMKVFFQEGQDVKKGDPLFQIDPRPYDLALRQAEAALAKDAAAVQQVQANLSRDIAQQKQADADAQRAENLTKQGILDRQSNERTLTAATTAAQVVAADRAAIVSAQTALNADRVAIESAKLNLVYCLIKSPIDGRTGPVAVKEGNLIKANADTAMVTINQVRPIYVSFSVPEDQLPDVRRQMRAGALQVQAANRTGKLTFIDNTVDTTTGTIKLKATFSNEDAHLWPGQFVDVTLGLSIQKDVTVVPSEAIQNGPKGQFVYVVNREKKADMRLVSAGRTVQRMTVVDKGVAAGETVIIDGQLRVVPGATVQAVAAPGSTVRP